MRRSEREKTKEYVLSLEALNCCLLLEEGRFAEVVKAVEELEGRVEEGKTKISEKVSKQMEMCRVQAFLEINEFALCITLIQKFMSQRPSLTLR
jgi:hypothetical protein